MSMMPDVAQQEANQDQAEFRIPETMEEIYEISNRNRKKNKERKKVLVQSKIYGIDILDRKQFRNNANTSNNNESVKRSSSCIDI